MHLHAIRGVVVSRSVPLGFLILCAGGLAFAAPILKGDAEHGKTLAEQHCAGCHGLDGNNPPAPTFPKLGGQQLGYLLHEVQEYKDDQRPSDFMKPAIQALSSNDLLDILTWFSSQPGTPTTTTRPELLELGKKIYLEGNSQSGIPSCDGCHEENGQGTERFPRIAGQNPEYLLEEFKHYTNGQRKYGKKIMRTIAERLTEQEAQAVAEYIATLK